MVGLFRYLNGMGEGLPADESSGGKLANRYRDSRAGGSSSKLYLSARSALLPILVMYREV